ncbi:MAG: hypothetical protein JRI46_09365 [Deltaproteobacteria bacterium]|nr:hypothetical protein [Deltaproteobacteria bacterium]
MRLQQFVRSLRLPLFLVILFGLVVSYGLFLHYKVEALKGLTTQTKTEEITSKKLLQDLDRLEQEAKKYKALSLDLWLPPFKDPLETRLFLLKYLSSLTSRCHGEDHEIEVTMGAEDQTGEVRCCDVMLKVKFKYYADLMEFLQALEQKSPLFIVEEIGLNKEGGRIATLLKLAFAYRIKKWG